MRVNKCAIIKDNFNKMQDLKERTKKFALEIIKLVNELPNTLTGRTIGGQLIRCGTSVAANYRASCRARSRSEFVAKLGIVEEEADESIFWMEILVGSDLSNKERIEPLLRENVEILSIIVASKKTARRNLSAK